MYKLKMITQESLTHADFKFETNYDLTTDIGQLRNQFVHKGMGPVANIEVKFD